MFTRRIAALAAALLTAFTVAAATTGGTAAASPVQSHTVQAAGSAYLCHPAIPCWRLPESPQACLLKFPTLR
jgi:threonine/homoserine/homoserine lactone efflux protein